MISKPFFGLALLVSLGIAGNVFAAGATLQDFWDGNASFAFQYTIPTGSNCNPDSGEIVPMDGVWYRFSRDYYKCDQGSGVARIIVEKSVDQGKTWTNKTVVIANDPGSPYEVNAVDGDAYYDADTNTWHYLFQCLASTGGWNVCHASRSGRDPMGAFTPDPKNPVIKGGDLWKRICDKSTDDCKSLATNGVFDEGTPDILKKVNGQYIVTFHGYDGKNGYRGIAATPDFVNWKIGSEAATPLASDDIFDKKDCQSWDSWDSGGCIGGGAADMLEDNGYDYMLIEAADKSLGCTANQKWDFGFLRSSSLANATWEQKGVASLYSQNSTIGCGIQYGKLFKDEAGQIYMIYIRLDNGRESLLKLVKNDDLALYQFWEGSGNITRSDLVRFGNFDAAVNNASWTAAGDLDSKLVFNGQNSYVQFPALADFNRAGSVFMEIKASINSAPASNSALLVGKTGSYWAEIYPSSLCLWINKQNVGPINVCLPLTGLIGNENTYQFLFDGSSLKIGVNGVEKASNNIGASSIVQSSNKLMIGGDHLPSAGYYGSFGGTVDYFRLAKTGQLTPANCAPKTCASLNYSCGSVSDGCNGTLNCGSCGTGQTCTSGKCQTTNATNGAQFISQSVPSAMTASQTYPVSVTMKNTGTTTWTAAASYKLGSQNPQDNAIWGNGRQILATGDSIAAGQSKTFTFNVTAPAASGTYNFQWQMLQENVQWFGDKTPNVAVTVTKNSTCTPNCSGKSCGDDGCGGSCGSCASGQTCSNGTCATGSSNVCGALSSFNGTTNDASGAIQSCIDNASSGGIVELPAGRYFVAHQIKINNKPVTLRTQGKTDSMPRCVDNNDCAEIVALTNFDGFLGIIQITQDGTSVDHVIVNGNNKARASSNSAAQCKGGSNGWGFNASAHISNFSFTNNIDENALCGTGLEMGGKVSNNRILNNLFISNGVHDTNSLWSDGLTVHDCSSCTFENNDLAGTDVDFIFGGCQNCSIKNNSIRHVDPFANGSFAGLMLFAWSNTSGNYTGTEVSNNTIDCGAKKRCGFGLYLGGHAWDNTLPIPYGGSIHDNTVTNAQQGLVIDDYANAEVYNNHVSNVSGDSYSIGTKSHDISQAKDTIGTVFKQVNRDNSVPNMSCANDCNLPANAAKFVAQSVPSQMVVGQSYQVSVVMQNNGVNVWNAAGSYRLGSQNAQDNSTWGVGRVFLSGLDSIELGNIKTFTFTVKAPTAPGTYNFQWQMVQDGVAWFGDKTPNVAVTVAKNSTCTPNCSGKSCGDDGCGGSCGSCASSQTCSNNTCVVAGSHAQFISQSVPSAMTAGQTYSVSVTMKNTGTTTWTAAASYKLGSQNPQDNAIWGNGRQILATGDSIASGQSKTFTFNIVAPVTSGNYNFQWQMLQENVQWFGDKTPNVAVTVTSTSQVPQCVNNACSSGLVCKDGNNCCKADQCGYDVYPYGQCVDNGGTRSQGPLATNFNLVCRSGVWKSMANSWGCNSFTCDSGTCQNNVCQTAVSACVPKTCASLGNVCGSVSDGCGGTLNCGICSATASPVVINNPDSVTNTNNSSCQNSNCPSGLLPVSTCTPKTCNTLIYNCGTASDGCGGTLQCGTCPSGQACTNNKCVTTVPQCSNNTCSSGLVCKDGNNCCKADQCGYDVYPNGQCVDNGGTRSQGPLATNFNLVCRNGVWKTVSGAWGCNYFACDIGPCLGNVCLSAGPINNSPAIIGSNLDGLAANVLGAFSKVDQEAIISKINEIRAAIAELEKQFGQ